MKKLSIYTFLVVFLFSFSLSANNENLYKKLNTFGDVFETIRSNYVSDVDEEDVIEAAINGMLQSLDPHSSYMNLENYKEMQEQTDGKFGGLGIEVTSEDGWVKIIYRRCRRRDLFCDPDILPQPFHEAVGKDGIWNR